MKLTKHAWSLWAISLAVILVLMIAIPFARTATWWIAAGCTVLMFALCACAFHMAFRKDNGIFSKVLGWPIFKVGYTVLIAQIVVGAILMGIAPFCPAWAAVIAEVVVFAATGICLTVKDAAREAVTQSESKVEDHTQAWKAIRARAASIAAESGHPDLKKLAEMARYADPTPTSMDDDIAKMLEILSSYADAANIKKALSMMEQRKALSMQEKTKAKD